MGWIPADPKTTFVGDAVRFTIWCTRLGSDGGPIYRVVEGREKLVQAPVKIAGRVVDHGDIEDIRDGLFIERTSIAWNGDVAVPRVLDAYARYRLRDVERIAEEGSKRRIHYEGRMVLRNLLRRAAGGDENDPQAVARVAACVHPAVLEYATRQGTLPTRLGSKRAAAMLDGQPTTLNSMFSEGVLRQLDGRMQIPHAADPVING